MFTPRRLRLSRRSLVGLLLSLPLAALIVGLAACLHVPVGDPETSKVDPKLSGVWTGNGPNNDKALYFLQPYDARTYLLRGLEYKVGDDGKIEPQQQFAYKAWLTPLSGATFITLQPLPLPELPDAAKPADDSDIKFAVGKLTLKDDTLTLLLTKPDAPLLKEVKDRAQAEAVIKAHVDDAAIYVDEPLTYKRVGKDEAAQAQAVLEAFKAK